MESFDMSLAACKRVSWDPLKCLLEPIPAGLVLRSTIECRPSVLDPWIRLLVQERAHNCGRSLATMNKFLPGRLIVLKLAFCALFADLFAIG